jgi:uncharacterized protein DUF4124
MKRLIVIAASLAFSASAAAQMYKWKDKDGHTRYGDVPPPGAEATAIGARSRAAPAAPPPAGEARGDKDDKSEKALTPEQAFRKRQQERAAAEEKAAKERSESARKQENCAQAQAQLRTLQSGQRIATLDAAGERTIMDDSQRAAETGQAEKAVADWCS